MNVTTQTATDQAVLWNGTAGKAWVDSQTLLDTLFKPFEDLLVEAAMDLPAARILDVGCGTGSTTLALARRPGATGRCIGVDISETMITAARARAEREHTPASFLCADAGSYAFEPASFDLVVSRFGVMFFDDPVGAFANLRRAASHGGTLRCIAWQGPEDNRFMTTAERAAASFLPNIPTRTPDEPGQFAFADADRVRYILEESGWTGVEIQPLEVDCTLPEAELAPYFTRLGPLGRILPGVDAGTREGIIEAVRAAFDPFVDEEQVRFTAACWMVDALAGS